MSKIKPTTCELCGQAPDFRGLEFHHTRFHRSEGGRKMNPDEGLYLCGKCHSLEHGIQEIQSRPQWENY